MGTPLDSEFFIDNVGLVEDHQCFRGGARSEDFFGVGAVSEESLNTAKKGFLVFLTSAQLVVSHLLEEGRVRIYWFEEGYSLVHLWTDILGGEEVFTDFE